MRYQSEFQLVPIRPESASTRNESSDATDPADPASSSNQIPPGDPTDGPTGGPISDARLTGDESEIDEYLSESVSEAPPRNLSSVATLTTYAAGDEDPDYPSEFDHPAEIAQIDFDRVGLTSMYSESVWMGEIINESRVIRN